MKAKDLKNSILQMAVQGKLVPQDPNDEPASVLLERIREERAKLIKQKKIKAPRGGESVIYCGSDGSYYEKRGSSEPVCIDDKIPFEIPESWEWARLGSIAYFTGGGTPDKSNPKFWNGKIPWASMKDIHGPVLESTIDSITEDGLASKTSISICEPGQLIVSTRLVPGKTIVSGIRCAINQDLKVMHAQLPIAYLTVWFESHLDDFKRIGSGTTVPGIKLSDLEEALVSLPPENEQVRILEATKKAFEQVNQYGALEDEREQLDAELPERLRKSILQMAVQGKLVPQEPSDEPASGLLERIRKERTKLIKEKKLKAPKGGESIIYRGSDGGYYEKRGNGEPVCIDDEIPFEIPENWEWARLGSLCNYGQCTNIEYGDIADGTWVLELEDIEKDAGRITVKRFKNGGSGSTKHVFHTGEILYSKLRPYLNKVVVADEDGAATSEILPLDFLGLIEPEYAQLALMSPHFLEYANVCSYGVKMPRLGTEDGQKALIPVAPYAEQSRIVVAVERALQELTNRQ